MIVIGENSVPHLRNTVAALGVFDGVHIGHQVIIKRVVAEAKHRGTKSVIVTFSKHPQNIISCNSSHVSMLTTFEEKCALIESMGVDYLYLINFTDEVRKMSAEDFLRQIIIESIGASTVVVGRHHSFGINGSGNSSTIDKIAEKLAISVVHVAGQYKEEIDIASSYIRTLVDAGNIAKANLLLGRPYSLEGIVVKGKGLGRELGYPTANLQLLANEKIVPKEGVYAVLIDHSGERYKGVMSIGLNPTIETTNRCSLEVNIFDFNKEIYGEKIVVYFLHYLRTICTFNSIEELVKQIEKDCQKAIALLN